MNLTQDKFPRVAVVATCPMRNDLATGIMLRSLFSGWPKSKLLNIDMPRGIAFQPQMDVCDDYRRIDFRGRVTRISQENLCDRSRREQALSAVKNKSEGRRRFGGLLLVAQELIAGAIWRRRALARELQNSTPDVVFAVVGNLALAKTVALVCDRLKIPLFLHVTDDYIESLYEHVPFSRLVKSLSKKWFNRAVKVSCGRSTIGSAMSKAFEDRYACHWSSFTTLVPGDCYDTSMQLDDSVVRFVYTGNLRIGRWDSLVGVARILESVQDTQGVTIELDIYASPEQIAAHESLPGIPALMNLRGWASAENLPAIFHHADVLLHVESFDPYIAKWIELSFSTKLSQYAMAGRCIVGCGPSSLASMQMIEESNSGVVLTSLGPSACEALRNIVMDRSVRYDYARNARDWGMEWFEMRAGQERLRLDMLNAISDSKSELENSFLV